MRSKGTSPAEMHAFLVEAFYGQMQFAEDRLTPRLASPSELDWDRYGKDNSKASAGTYTVNPELRGLDLAATNAVIGTIPDSIRLRKSLRRFYNNADWLGGIGMVSNQIVLLKRS